jgi:tRNA(Ile)-lysidine synthetase-like protein
MRSTRKSLTLEARVARSLAQAGVKAAARLVVGVSGGPDSTALLVILSSLHREKAYELHACIVDHGIRDREEVEGDIAFVGELTRSLGVTFRLLEVQAGECAALCRSEGRSLEEVARERRLSLLESAAAVLHADAIVLGHTRDDEVETLLMRVLQGSGVEGLSGIARRRGLFVRPLLSSSRSEILHYLQQNRVSFRTDSTNLNLGILRNRVRALLIPALDTVHPGFRAGLISMSRKLRLSKELLVAEAADRLRWKEGEGRYRIDVDVFMRAPAALRAHSLLCLYDRMRGIGSPRRLSFSFLTPALGSRISDTILLEGHGIRLRRDGDELVWERDIVTEGEKRYFIPVETDGSYIVSGAALRVDFTKENSGEGGLCDARILETAINPPLVLRSKRKGDTILLTYGRKSVKELLSEWKVPHDQRRLIPFLADRSGIVAVLGGVFGFPVRIRTGAQSHAGKKNIVVRASRILERGVMEGSREQQL